MPTVTWLQQWSNTDSPNISPFPEPDPTPVLNTNPDVIPMPTLVLALHSNPESKTDPNSNPKSSLTLLKVPASNQSQGSLTDRSAIWVRSPSAASDTEYGSVTSTVSTRRVQGQYTVTRYL